MASASELPLSKQIADSARPKMEGSVGAKAKRLSSHFLRAMQQ